MSQCSCFKLYRNAAFVVLVACAVFASSRAQAWYSGYDAWDAMCQWEYDEYGCTCSYRDGFTWTNLKVNCDFPPEVDWEVAYEDLVWRASNACDEICTGHDHDEYREWQNELLGCDLFEQSCLSWVHYCYEGFAASIPSQGSPDDSWVKCNCSWYFWCYWK
jgi:hypothetical protein